MLLISLLLCAISVSFSCSSASFAKPSTVSFPKIPQCYGIHSKRLLNVAFLAYTKDVLFHLRDKIDLALEERTIHLEITEDYRFFEFAFSDTL